MHFRRNAFLSLALVALAVLFITPQVFAHCGSCDVSQEKADGAKTSCSADSKKACNADKAEAKACPADKKACCASASASAGKSCTGPCPLSTEECSKKVRAYYETHGWMGIELDQSASDAGPRITRVFPNSPASKAGLKVGDILTSLNGLSAAPEYAEQLHAYMESSFNVGKRIRFTAKRDQEILPMTAVLTKIPSDAIDVMIDHHMQTAHVDQERAKEKAENVQ